MVNYKINLKFNEDKDSLNKTIIKILKIELEKKFYIEKNNL